MLWHNTRKYLAALTAAIIMTVMSLTCFAQSGTSAYQAVLFDEQDLLTQEQETNMLDLMETVAAAIECNIGVVISDCRSNDYAKYYREATFGKHSDSIVLLFNNNNSDTNKDQISTGGRASELYDKNITGIFDEVYKGLDTNGYETAIIWFVSALLDYYPNGGAELPDDAAEQLPDTSVVNYRAVLEDPGNFISSSDEEMLLEIIQETANAIECHVGVISTDNLHGKSDSRFANDFLDEKFGYDSSAVVLLLIDDDISSTVDWISTSGRARDYFDSKVDRIFDNIYDGFDYGDGYCDAIKNFCSSLKRYSGGSDYASEFHMSIDVTDLLITFGFPIIIATIFTIIIVSNVVNGYSKRAPVSAAVYLEKDRTQFTGRVDQYIREYTTSHTSSSSSGGGGGGGHRSSGHGGGGGRSR